MKLLFILLSAGSFLLDHGGSFADSVSVSVMEGDSVTLNTGVKKTQHDRIRWYYNGIRIAYINGDQSKICTDVQCNNGTERFIDRLKLDHQTGSLTIMNTRNTDSGEYKLQISNISSNSEKIFNVVVNHDKTNKEPRIAPNERETDMIPDSASGLSAGAVVGICVAVLLVCAAAGGSVMMYRRRRSFRKDFERKNPELLQKV